MVAKAIIKVDNAGAVKCTNYENTQGTLAHFYLWKMCILPRDQPYLADKSSTMQRCTYAGEKPKVDSTAAQLRTQSTVRDAQWKCVRM